MTPMRDSMELDICRLERELDLNSTIATRIDPLALPTIPHVAMCQKFDSEKVVSSTTWGHY